MISHYLGNWSIGRPWGRSISDGLTLVPDVSNITRSGIKNIVGDNLGTTIRKGNTIFSIGGVAIAVLIVSILGISIDGISLNSIAKVIYWGSVRVNWGGDWSIRWNWGRSV